MSADGQKIRAVFLAAVENHAPGEWEGYLDAACAGDGELRRRVEVLLRAHQQPNSLLDSPAPALAGMVDEPLSMEQPGTVIGPYQILQQIGEGGMGIVYMAEQHEPVRRKVALKIIKPGMDSAQVIARFEAERQAVAMMDHQNIAKVFDAGTTDTGRPYFVMELVHGVPITQFCDENHSTPRERLQLFVPVCQAIQHAHQKGIIHRDIKPSNVLVTLCDGKPVPKVIDFGVAKAIEQRLTEKTLFTKFGVLVGTFDYMSPEQADLNALGVDTRSDIYSLGALLYELLTSTTPLERERLRQAGLDDVVRIIKTEEPPRPSVRLSRSSALPRIAAARKTEPAKLCKRVRGEIDWIVMKCLEKDRSRRYETVDGLARDLERYLHDEPVEACPPSACYRLRKFARKYRMPMAVAAGLAVLLVGIAVTSWQAVRLRWAEQRLQFRRDATLTEQAMADAKASQAFRDARRGRFQEAEQAYYESLGHDPSHHYSWFYFAPVTLYGGDVAAYRQICREMLRRWSDTDDPVSAEQIAKTCLLIPDAVSDLRQALHLVDRAVIGPEHSSYRWFLLVQGIGAYRAGRFANAIDPLNKTLSLEGDHRYHSYPYLKGMALLFLAMVDDQLGRTDQARKALDQAREECEQKYPEIGRGKDLGFGWEELLRFHIVRREAEKLLNGKAEHMK
jgi:serine/threonine protein kinase